MLCADHARVQISEFPAGGTFHTAQIIKGRNHIQAVQQRVVFAGEFKLDGLHHHQLTQQSGLRGTRHLIEPVGIADAHLTEQLEQSGFGHLAVHKAGRRSAAARLLPLAPRPGGHVIRQCGRVEDHMAVQTFNGRSQPSLMDFAGGLIGLAGSRFFLRIRDHGQRPGICQRLDGFVSL